MQLKWSHRSMHSIIVYSRRHARNWLRSDPAVHEAQEHWNSPQGIDQVSLSTCRHTCSRVVKWRGLMRYECSSICRVTWLLLGLSVQNPDLDLRLHPTATTPRPHFLLPRGSGVTIILSLEAYLNTSGSIPKPRCRCSQFSSALFNHGPVTS